MKIVIGVFRHGRLLWLHRRLTVNATDIPAVDLIVGVIASELDPRLEQGDYFAWDYERR